MLNIKTLFNTEDVTVLLAPAGAGKTTWLIDKIKQSLLKYEPEQIAFATFTRKGVIEGKERICKEVHITEESLPYFRTWHSLTFSELGYTKEMMMDYKQIQKFNAAFKFNLIPDADSSTDSYDNKLLAWYDLTRSGKEIPTLDEGFDSAKYRRFVNAYESFKKAYGLKDFYDCLIDFVAVGEPINAKVGFIDEAQDLTELQWRVASKAFSSCETIYIAGDDFQAIYSYAGARPEILISMAKHFKTIKLEKSYRIPKSVYRLASNITEALKIATPKDYAPAYNKEGKVEVIDNESELLYKVSTQYERTDDAVEWYLLFRCNAFVRRATKYLYNACVPFFDSKGFCIRNSELSKLSIYNNLFKEGANLRVDKDAFMKRYGITGKEDCFTDTDLFDEDRKYIILSYVEKYGLRKLKLLSKDKQNILVSTVHKIKGGEAKKVVFFLDVTRKVFASRYEDMDGELRLLYVACTRAKEELYLVKSQGEYGLDDIILSLKGETE